jgi:hypothetical protein
VADVKDSSELLSGAGRWPVSWVRAGSTTVPGGGCVGTGVVVVCGRHGGGFKL